MLWELYQLGQIRNVAGQASMAARSAHEAASDLQTMRREVNALEQQVERLTLATIAMVEILRERHGVTEADLEAKVREIDLRDGKLDGKVEMPQQPPPNCPTCGRPNGPTRSTCLYCSAPMPVNSLLK